MCKVKLYKLCCRACAALVDNHLPHYDNVEYKMQIPNNDTS